MELKGKKIVFLGDSITESYGASCVEKVCWNLTEKHPRAQLVVMTPLHRSNEDGRYLR